MDAEGARLGAAVEALGRTRRNDPVPEPLRSEVMAYAESRRRAGASWQSISRAVRISASGLKRWAGVQNGESRLRAVRVRREGGAQGAPSPLTLVTASGLRLEGLSRQDAVAIVRELGL
jgi:hypothetical protein